ncbi:hypothetical protein ABZ137_02460 [Streptomyces bobili]|uniref:hypothetical protein n=1 Tax=Streptomyces bobili TaxID=67280 RepID=UPI0033A89B0D
MAERLDHEQAGNRLGVPAGQAFLIATGLPADGGDTLTTEEQHRPGMTQAPSQHLVSPGADTPIGKPAVRAWLRNRANGAQTRRAARSRSA